VDEPPTRWRVGRTCAALTLQAGSTLNISTSNTLGTAVAYVKALKKILYITLVAQPQLSVPATDGESHVRALWLSPSLLVSRLV